jgi:hypothetical protein
MLLLLLLLHRQVHERGWHQWMWMLVAAFNTAWDHHRCRAINSIRAHTRIGTSPELPLDHLNRVPMRWLLPILPFCMLLASSKGLLLLLLLLLLLSRSNLLLLLLLLLLPVHLPLLTSSWKKAGRHLKTGVMALQAAGY